MKVFPPPVSVININGFKLLLVKISSVLYCLIIYPPILIYKRPSTGKMLFNVIFIIYKKRVYWRVCISERDDHTSPQLISPIPYSSSYTK